MKKNQFNAVWALASSMSLLSGSQFVYAQQAGVKDKIDESTAIEEVVVTGFRKSVVNALEVKRSADTVVEAISADDIGGLPDVSIADSLSRLPGVNTVRTGGQASEINIRGMSGDFVFATMNGREQVSTSTGPVAGRKIEFDVYPSELISQAAVYKSPKASLIEGGVSGTIEMTTVNPLNNTKEHSFAGGIRGSKNSRSDEVEDAIDTGSRLNLSYQGKFADDTLGVALGYAKLDAPNVANQYIGLNYTGKRDADGNTTTGFLDKGAQTGKEYLSEGMEMQQRSGEEKRDSFLGAVVWNPVDDFTLKGDVFQSKADTNAFARGFRIKSLANASSISNPTIIDNTVVGGTFTSADNLAVFVVNDNDSSTSEVLNMGLNAEWILDKLTVTADLSYSESDGDFVNGGTRALLYQDASVAKPIRATESITYLNQGLRPAQISLDKPYDDVSKLMLTEVGQWPFGTHNEIIAQRLDFKYDLDTNFIKSLEAGLRYSEREYTGKRAIDHYGSEFGDSVKEAPLKIPAGAVKVVGFRGELTGYPNFVSLDLNDATSMVAAARGTPWNPTATWNDSWTMIQTGTVKEDVTAGYVMANFETDLAEMPLTGNLGVRVVNSDQNSDGILQIGGGKGEEITDGRGVVSKDYVKNVSGKTYTDYLPSLNMNLAVTDNDQIRFGLAKVMSRPPVSKMKSGAGSWIDGENNFNVWGNTSPYLDPMYATQADLSYEHYLEDNKGAIVVAVFRKNIESFVEDTTVIGLGPADFRALGFNVPDTNPITDKPLGNNGQFQTAFNNTKGGYIQGVELGYTQTFNFLPGFWSGLGVSASYSYTESDVTRTNSLGGPEQNIDMPGLSPTNISTTVFYDYEAFSTRLNYRYRDAFVADQVAVESQEVFYAEEAVLDYQASYKLDNGVEFVFQVNNLTDEPSKTYFGSEMQTGTIQYFGRQYFLGLNYKL
jgi:iron complex outermembrane recepter protein